MGQTLIQCCREADISRLHSEWYFSSIKKAIKFNKAVIGHQTQALWEYRQKNNKDSHNNANVLYPFLTLKIQILNIRNRKCQITSRALSLSSRDSGINAMVAEGV